MSACLQAALVAELLALGNQVDAMQTQQQLGLLTPPTHLPPRQLGYL